MRSKFPLCLVRDFSFSKNKKQNESAILHHPYMIPLSSFSHQRSAISVWDVKTNSFEATWWENAEWNLLRPEFCLQLSQQYRSKREYLQSPRGKYLGYEFYILASTEALYMTVPSHQWRDTAINRAPIFCFFTQPTFQNNENCTVRDTLGPLECYQSE